MKHRTPLIFIATLTAIVSAQAPQDEALHFTHQESGGHALTWLGKKGRTYFLQHSADLQSWAYLPEIWVGDQAPLGSLLNSTTEMRFARTVHADHATADAALADFDLDGLGNRAELLALTDPFHADTDRDGRPDGAEVSAGDNPLSAIDGDTTYGGDADADRISDIGESLRGLSATLLDSDGDGVADFQDVYPLDPERQTADLAIAGDTTQPLLTIELPTQAVFVSGP